MKKKILGLALVAMSLVTFNGMAQTPNNTTNCGGTCTTKTCNKQVKNDAGKCKVNPFDGLNLTDAQKTQLEQLKSKRTAARQEKAKVAKENKQRNDSARVADRRADKKQYLEEVKAIIGPDQYVVFLENMYINGGNQGNGKAFTHNAKKQKAQGNRHGKSGKANRHGNHASKRQAAPVSSNANS